MDNLTVMLAVLGGLVLTGIVAHGAWQTRRADPRKADDESSHAHTVPLEPSLDAPLDGEVAGALLGAARRGEPRLEALIDALTTITLERPISGDAVLAHAPTTRRVGTKALAIEGLNISSGEWEPLRAGARYRQLQLGVQMANRHGPINEIEYSEFAQKVQGVSEAVGGMADLPDMLDIMARARELDSFASAHDVQLAIHLRARSAAWSPGYIQQHAGRHGFVAGVLPGRMVLPAAEEGAPPVLTLSFDPQAALAEDPGQAAVRDVTLSFDVPQTDPKVNPFNGWRASAEALSMGMDAALVDDVGNTLSPQSFDAIGAELNQVYEALAARDLAAGSPVARRLFS
jgi:hypothetical protein